MTASPLLQVLAFALLPTGAMLAGGGFALWRVPNAAWRSTILHFAAGVVFSVVAVELLPDIVKEHKPLEVALGFGGGVAAMLGLRAWMSRMEGVPERAAVTRVVPSQVLPLGLLFGIAVDLIVDGLLLGVGFAAGQKEGMLLAFALTAEVLALGLATSAQLRREGCVVLRVLAVLGALSLSFLIGAIGGATLLSNLSGEMLELVLSFGLAALLFLVTEELLVEAHEEAETPALTASFFGGFLLFLLLGMSA
jgi:ZIP family zinc transporter